MPPPIFIINFMQIKEMKTETDINACFNVYKELRPHLTTPKNFVDQILNQQKEGFRLFAIESSGEVAAAIGIRTLTTTAWGKILYIDDLISGEKFRAQGFGSALLQFAQAEARNLGCDQVHLDTGYNRHAAHKVYLNHGLQMVSHHMSLIL